ncbi:MAG: leucine-rich repeat domain-containing protein [Bacteroidales bacterium]|nr:leucine-rich repeat domain-containing protein [Bacteroidales bacterium]
MKTIIRILAVACGIASVLLSFTGCSKSTIPETVKEPDELTANINDVNTRTALNGLKVSWIKNDSIAIQTSRQHGSNSSNPRGYNTCLGTYRLMDNAAGSDVGKFTYVSGDDAVTGDEEFFAFYPASFCSGNEDNGYFYCTFPTNQCYEDNIGEKLPLPMYGVGNGKVIDFQYAGSVIRLKVWSQTATEIHSCTISASGLYKKAFTYYKDGEWSSSLHPAHLVNNLVVDMKTPVSISTDANNPTVIPIILPMSGQRILKNLKFSINCTDGGCELEKKSDLTINPGSAVNFPVKEIKIDSTRMYVDGLEGEVDYDWIKTAEKSVRVTMPESAMLLEDVFKGIMEATRSLNQQTDPEHPFSQISMDLSGTRAKNSTINGLDNDQNYSGFCGGRNRDSGIKNISEFRLPEGITQIMNRAFAYSDYTKIVLPSTVQVISGSPSNGNDQMIWEVNADNKYFKTDDKGALYNYDKTTLMVLNGGSGDSYTVPDGTETIREWALYENSVIETLTLPATVKEMKENCITGTPNLSTIICLGERPAIYTGKNGTKNKAGSSGIKTIYVPKGCIDAYKTAWAELVNDGWIITDETIQESNK